MKLFYGLISFILLLNSCCFCSKNNLTKEEKEWTNAYSKGQILKFISNKENIDSFLVTESRDFYTNENCNCIEVSDEKNQTSSITLKPLNCRDTFYCEVSISITKENNKKDAFPTMNVYNLFSNKLTVDSKTTSKTIALTTDKKKYEVLYCENLNIRKFGNNAIKSFYWNKEHGLIKYETSENEIFELMKN